MVDHLLSFWRRAATTHQAMPSWRGLVGDPVWSMFPAVLLVDKLARRNSYEVYVKGQQISREWLLDDAKSRAEKELGPLMWNRATLEQINALHYYYGWTSEFTDPPIAYLGRPLLGDS